MEGNVCKCGTDKRHYAVNGNFHKNELFRFALPAILLIESSRG